MSLETDVFMENSGACDAGTVEDGVIYPLESLLYPGEGAADRCIFWMGVNELDIQDAGEEELLLSQSCSSCSCPFIIATVISRLTRLRMISLVIPRNSLAMYCAKISY